MANISVVLPKVAKASVVAELATGCPAEVIAAQCILESGWLDHSPSNNCFGIKEFPGCVGRQRLTTKEWFTLAEEEHFLSGTAGRVATKDGGVAARADGRERYTVQDWFATFKTLDACFTKRAEMWDKGCYASAACEYRQDRDLPKFVAAMAKHYATSPTYAQQVLSITCSPKLVAALKEARA